MALLMIGLAALGLYMVTLPDAGFDTKKITLILYHKEFGLLAFVLFALRLGWRVTQVIPKLVDHLPEWQMINARFVHLCFYGLIVGFAREVADRVIFMDQGKVLERARPERFFHKPEHPRAQRFLSDIRSPWESSVAA